MTDNITSLSETLRPAFYQTLKRYLDFTAQTPGLEPKDCTAYHNACKAALAHLILLEKLIKHPNSDDAQMNLLDLIEQAKEENKYEHFTPDEFA